MSRHPLTSTLFPYTTLFRSSHGRSTLNCFISTSTFFSFARSKISLNMASVIRKFFTNQSRSEEHTSELQSHVKLVCRLLLEKKKQKVEYNFQIVVWFHHLSQ